MKCALCIPTLNAAATAQAFLAALNGQSFAEFERLLVDSSSTDGTPELFAAAGFRVHTIPRTEFNHGATRQLAVDLCPDADIIIFMTQDAILAHSSSLQRLVDAFDDPRVGAAYGRQLPAKGATPVAAHARLFNYPPESHMRGTADIPRWGIKTAFLSNSFAAYRREALRGAGGFPSDAIFGEDTWVAARMLQAGWTIAYCAEAQVRHSHSYSMGEEFRRYFDIGVFHGREEWFLGGLGRAEGEGKKFVVSEFKYLLGTAPWYIPSALFRTVLKFAGYRLGLQEKYLPDWLKRRVSLNRLFWG
ncbi:glycosyltransferase family 2 protein [Geomobilimonas luticola]|uniref:glycosyltransferase family 2 protein n=1 Tax=Geomobilimonas luticola TaxID=1114878 RepID=UPI001BDA8010